MQIPVKITRSTDVIKWNIIADNQKVLIFKVSKDTFFFLTGLRILMTQRSSFVTFTPSKTSLYLPLPTFRTTSQSSCSLNWKESSSAGNVNSYKKPTSNHHQRYFFSKQGRQKRIHYHIITFEGSHIYCLQARTIYTFRHFGRCNSINRVRLRGLPRCYFAGTSVLQYAVLRFKWSH